MGEFRDLLDRERRRFTMPEGSIDDLERRRDRKRRNHRIATAALALVIAAAGIGGGLYAFRPTGEGQPAQTPTPSGSVRPTPAPSESPSPIVPPTAQALPSTSGPIQFVDDQRGWAVGPNAEVLSTSDGGRTWKKQYGGPLKVAQIQFFDDQDGWAVADDGKGLLRTVDGGVTWKFVSDHALSPMESSLQFASPLIGWAVDPSNGRVVKSTDGGKTWVAENVEANSVCASSGGAIVWAAGHGQAGVNFVRSDDGGATWVDVPIDVPQDFGGGGATLRCGGNDAWILILGGGAAGHQAYALYRTAESGSARPVLQEPGTHPLGEGNGVTDAEDPYPGPFLGFDGSSALFVGWCPACNNSVALYATSDAGAHWDRSELVKEGATPMGMSFADRQHGWLLLDENGPKGLQWTVMATSDGGKSWSTLR